MGPGGRAAPDPAPTELGAESAGIEVRMYTPRTFQALKCTIPEDEVEKWEC